MALEIVVLGDVHGQDERLARTLDLVRGAHPALVLLVGDVGADPPWGAERETERASHDASVRRAGLDYREMAAVHSYPDLETCLRQLQPARLLIVETGGVDCYSRQQYQPGDALLFGRETSGLPQSVLDALPDALHVSIPMRPGNRSLNLSNAVAVVVFEAWRQQGFAGS